MYWLYWGLLIFSTSLYGQTTERMWLSGTGNDATVPWDFLCTKGRNSGLWTTISVPSCWELQGFGTYNWGNDKVHADEEGFYRHSFTLPESWKNKRVFIVFEGSMTDTEVKINGRLAGPMHQGAFYQFRYEITSLLKPNRPNQLEVRVSKRSANTSVNEAERTADYWIFGGIFRPVYLEAMPAELIRRVTIDAKSNGALNLAVWLDKPLTAGAYQLTAQVKTMAGQPVGEALTARIGPAMTDTVRLAARFDSPALWSPEQPNRYQVEVVLSRQGKPLHKIRETFGFRTLELRPRDGLYLNGQKIHFKGINRGPFWPTSGRTTSQAISVLDVNLIKDMNMNAVRMSHYPPDAHFLDTCDSLGLLVIDELAGWQFPPYDTEVGRKLIREMLERDVNHPSVVMWSNGNEGGFNFDLEPEYHQLDPQQRPVIHPWMNWRGADTQHYIDFGYGVQAGFQGRDVFFPTEFMHGVFDGGHGAGLQDFWNAMRANPLSAGGFLWDFCDQAIVRTDENGRLDTKTSAGADGIVGPYREKEASFFAVKEIWAPLAFPLPFLPPTFSGLLPVENRFYFTNLKACQFTWKLTHYSAVSPSDTVTVRGHSPSPDVLPQQSGWLSLDLPADFHQRYDVLYVTVHDPHGREIFTWSWNLSPPGQLARRVLGSSGTVPTMTQDGQTIRLTSGSVKVEIDRQTGLLASVSNASGRLPFSKGPLLVEGAYAVDTVTTARSDSSCMVNVTTRGKHAFGWRWTMYHSGWLELTYSYSQRGNWDAMGITFSLPDSTVQQVDLLADGPYRVWKNRQQGGQFGWWLKTYNNGVTGERWEYPEFKGYYRNFYAARLQTTGGSFRVISASEDLYLRLLTPQPPRATNDNTSPYFPPGNLSFLHGISAIGTKFQKPETIGPQGQKNMYTPNRNTAPLRGRLLFDFH